MELFLKISTFLIRFILNPVIVFFMRLYYQKDDKKYSLPPVNKLLLIPAHVLAKKIRNKEITSTEIVQAYVDRIKQIQPIVNCVVKDCFEEALQEARNVDKLLSSDKLPEEFNEKNAPLLGVPFSCKESLWVKGMPNSTGIIGRKDFRAPDDCDVVKNMRRAGAILLCVTNTSETCIWIESTNFLNGTSRNPYNLTRIVGGSSGGEGCIVSSAGAVIGIGSDIGGSIRIPSFFNGVYGHKSSYGLISNKVQYPPLEGDYVQSMLATGPICRYASDLRLLFKVQAGSLYGQMAEKFDSKVELDKLNYFVFENFDGCFQVSSLSQECRDAMKKAVDFIEKSFNKKVVRLDSSKFKNAFFIFSTLIRNGNRTSLAHNTTLATNDGVAEFRPFLELLKAIFRCSNHTVYAILYALMEKDPLPATEKFIKELNDLRNYFDETLGNNGILLSPGFPEVAPYHNQTFFANTYDFLYFGIYNALQLPSTACPMGLCPKTGLPTGLQVLSNVKCDHLTIRLAEYFEENLVGWTPGFPTDA